MHPDIRKLLEVQKVDRELARIRRDLESLPGEEQRRRQRLGQARQQSEEAKGQLMQAEVESRTHEKSIRGADDEIRKLESRLNTVKNNAEYQATLFQIESVKRERSAIEDEGMALLDRLEELRTSVRALQERVAGDEGTFAEFQEEAARLRAARERDAAAGSARREGLVAGIAPELLRKYTTIFEVRDGQAVCAVEGEVCTGCYTRITPNDLTRLMGATSLVQCGSCQRLLYLREE